MRASIRKNDTVMVVAGRERGKTGKVVRVIPEKSRAIVERLNMVKRHTKARGQGKQGGILEKEAPLAISNVMLYDPKAGRGVRVGSRVTKDGKRERISRATGEAVGKTE